MIDREQLRELHDQDLPLHVLEQDYIQAIFLSELYSESENLVFKGGTFLKHAYGLDRFSEDLDFTSKNDSSIQNQLEKAKNSLSDYGIEAEIDSISETPISFSCRLKYRGPLFNGDERSVGSIEIDVSKREDVFLEPEWTRLFFEYPEVRVINALGLNKKELLAEKIRALSTRTKARDLYDVWFLLKQNTELEYKLFKKKMEVVDEEPSVKINTDEENWRRDLEIFLENPPEFKQVKSEVIEKLKQADFQLET
jgi:predicted nucleotidyltransferase component of viral defense system